MRKGNTVGDEVLIATYNSKNRTVTDGHLTEIFSAVGQRYGYEDVKAEFAPLKDFKVRWQRSYNWAIFTISDYLDRAPDAVLEDLAAVLFAKITGENREYGDVFLNYVTDRNLTRTNRKDFLKRSRNLSKDSIGEFHDLNDCVNRLRDLGLIPDDLECVLTWDSSVSARMIASPRLATTMMISSCRGSPSMPPFLFLCIAFLSVLKRVICFMVRSLHCGGI